MQLTINKEIQIHPNIFSPSKYPCEVCCGVVLFFLVKTWHIEKQEGEGRKEGSNPDEGAENLEGVRSITFHTLFYFKIELV